MNMLLAKILFISLTAAICGAVAGVLFSLWFYGIIPDEQVATKVYLSDTYAKVKLRFWIAFAVGAVFGGVWSYRMARGSYFK